MSYAAGTRVAPDRSRAEIERILVRYGAEGFMYGWESDRAGIGFLMRGRQVRLMVPMPDDKDPMISQTPSGKPRTDIQIADIRAREVRRRWRACVLVIKAKLEAVETGISTVEAEFLANFVLPCGETVGEKIQGPELDRVLAGGKFRLLPGPKGKAEA